MTTLARGLIGAPARTPALGVSRGKGLSMGAAQAMESSIHHWGVRAAGWAPLKEMFSVNARRCPTAIGGLVDDLII